MNKMDHKIKQAYEDIQMADEAKDRIHANILASDPEQNKGKLYQPYLAKVAVFVICLLVCSGTVYAAYHLLSAGEAALKLGDEKLADKFNELSHDVVFQQNETFRAAYLGEVTGKNLSQYEIDAEEEKTYFVMAIERIDGQKITYDDNILVSPFVKGMAPWQFNIFFMGGAYTGQIIDDVLYMIYDCGNLELFADKGVYLGVTDSAPSAESYQYDSQTGIITSNAEYSGLNLLFELELDVSKADPQKAEAYLQSLGVMDSEDQSMEDDSDTSSDFDKEAFMQNGYQDLENPEEMIAKSTLIEESVTILQENEDGFLKYVYDDIFAYTSARLVREIGMDTVTFYGDDDETIVEFAVIEYKDGQYIGKVYLCNNIED